MEIDKKIIKKLVDALEDLKKSLKNNNEEINTQEIVDEEIDTVGGLIFFLAGKVPRKEEIFQYNNFLKFKILSASDRSIKTLEIDKI